MGKRAAACKFPVARIKKIMQANDEIGKVSAATPVAISKALELFMEDIMSSAAMQAKERGSKRISTYHLKRTVHGNETFDFLKDIVAKIPDPVEGAGASSSTSASASASAGPSSSTAGTAGGTDGDNRGGKRRKVTADATSSGSKAAAKKEEEAEAEDAAPSFSSGPSNWAALANPLPPSSKAEPSGSSSWAAAGGKPKLGASSSTSAAPAPAANKDEDYDEDEEEDDEDSDEDDYD